MNIDLDPWFIGGATLFAMSGVLHLSSMWRGNDAGEERSKWWSKISLDISLGYWSLLLVCWLLHTGGQGASRLWFGLSALAVGLSYRLIDRRVKVRSLGGVISALIALLAVFSYQLSGEPSLTAPSVDSSMPTTLIIHIALAVAGLAAFAVSASMSGLYLVVAKRLKSKQLVMGSKRLPSLSTLDEINLKGLLIGFPLYTGALLVGSAYAFGGSGELSLSYLVSLGSWSIYGGVLQARLTAGWRGQRAAWLTLIAFIGILLVAASYSFR